ncbi:putative DNA replication complex GINS protein PSF2 [Dictyocoela muelleri]|nr:putative DNA replication complex GINS protein PSF2 [Dictyocoela muelleri]
MKPDELLLIARHLTEVEIEPLTSIPKISLLEYDIGPLTPLNPAVVPLFVALTLKKSGLCRIRAPSFFKEENLLQILEFEIKNENEFSKVHDYLFEIKRDIVDNSYNLNNKDTIRKLINEIREVRFGKIYNGLKMIDGHAMNLNNITEFELNQIKPFLLKTIGFSRQMNIKDRP